MTNLVTSIEGTSLGVALLGTHQNDKIASFHFNGAIAGAHPDPVGATELLGLTAVTPLEGRPAGHIRVTNLLIFIGRTPLAVNSAVCIGMTTLPISIETTPRKGGPPGLVEVNISPFPPGMTPGDADSADPVETTNLQISAGPTPLAGRPGGTNSVTHRLVFIGVTPLGWGWGFTDPIEMNNSLIFLGAEPSEGGSANSILCLFH